MAVLRPFRAVRPRSEYAADVAALPYDCMNSREAAEMVKGNPYSFLHVDKAEIDLPDGTDLYSQEVYLKAKENLSRLSSEGICKKDEKPMFYIYRQIMNGRAQTGLVGCVGIDDYINNVVKKHELTFFDKEKDRINHVSTCNAHTGPIFLTYRRDAEISEIISSVQQASEPVCDFTKDDGVRSTIWVIDDDAKIARISEIFSGIDSLYIADGHHRAASAVHVGTMRREQNPGYDGSEEFNAFLAVLFPCDDLKIMDYNRVMKGLNGYTPAELIEKISEKFTVRPVGKEAYSPEKPHEMGMLLDGEWYSVTARPGTFDPDDVIGSLDVSILQNNLIGPVLGITNPRSDKRIDFVGGIRGLGELEKRVSEDMDLAFSMYPTSVYELMKIADAGEIMPPKSTWFEPKLLSGLFIHELSD